VGTTAVHGSWKIVDSNRVPEGQQAQDGGGMMDPRRLWAIARRRWRVILSTAAVVGGLVILWVLQITPIYTATTQILIDARKERVLGRSEAVVGDLGLDASAIATEVTLIKSFSIARRVVERLRLEQNAAFRRSGSGFSLTALVSGPIRQLLGRSESEDEPLPEARPRAAGNVFSSRPSGATRPGGRRGC
jgi:uncharacterized protein involved in exopolysaccharide biosynthesis